MARAGASCGWAGGAELAEGEVVCESGTPRAELVSFCTVGGEEVGGGVLLRLVLEQRNVHKLGDEADGRLGEGDVVVVVRKGVLEVARLAVLRVGAVRGEDGVVAEGVGRGVEREGPVDVRGEEGRVAEVVDGVGADEGLEEVALGGGVCGEAIWARQRRCASVSFLGRGYSWKENGQPRTQGAYMHPWNQF